MKKAGIIMIATMALAGCATPEKLDHTNVVLIKAHINSLVAAENPEIGKSSANTIEVGMETLVSISVTDVLIGRLQQQPSSVKLRMSAWPQGERLKDILILAKVKGSGELEAVGWDYAVHGICVNSETARALNIENDLSSLYESGKLKCSQ